MTERMKIADIDVVIKIPNSGCTYSSKDHMMCHDSGPYSNETCNCIGGHIGGPLADKIAREYADEIRLKQHEYITRHQSRLVEYENYLSAVDQAIKNNVEIFELSVYNVENFGLPSLKEETIKNYNICGKMVNEVRRWYLVRRPSIYGPISFADYYIQQYC